MANNQYVNKVIYGDQTLIDLTSDSVSPSALVEGYTAHMCTGEKITGSIPIRSPVTSFTNGHLRVQLDYGLYGGTLSFNKIQIPVPSTDTNSIIIEVPNGTNNPDPSEESDWIPITFIVDTSGNSEVTDDTIPANGVSF